MRSGGVEFNRSVPRRASAISQVERDIDNFVAIGGQAFKLQGATLEKNGVFDFSEKEFDLVCASVKDARLAILNRAGRGRAFSEAIDEVDNVGAMIMGVGGDAVVGERARA